MQRPSEAVKTPRDLSKEFSQKQFSFENFVFRGQLVKHYFRDRFLVVALEPSLASLDDPVAVSVELSSRLDLPGKIKNKYYLGKFFKKIEKNILTMRL